MQRWTRLCAACALVVLLPGTRCRKSAARLPAEGVVVMRAVPATGAGVVIQGRPYVLARPLLDTDPLTPAVAAALAAPGGVDALAILERARALVAGGGVDAEGAAAVAAAKDGAVVIVGAPETLWARGLAVPDAEGHPVAHADVTWTSLATADTADDGTLEQALPGRVTRLAFAMVLQRALVTAGDELAHALCGHPWLLTDPLSALLQGVDLHAQVLTRRLSTTGKLASAITVERAVSDADVRAAAVLQDRYAFRPAEPTEPLGTPEARAAFLKAWTGARPPPKGTPWSGAQMVGVPGVVATVLTHMGDDPEVGGGVPAADFFKPFYGGKLPAGFSPSGLGGPVLFRLKLLHAAHARLGRADAPPFPGIHTLVDAYGNEFPNERKAALRALVLATHARTATAQDTSGVEGPAIQLRVTDEVLGGTRYVDGAVGAPLMVQLADVVTPRLDGTRLALAFNLNAAMAWQLSLVPGMDAEDSARLAARLAKTPVEKLDELSGQIPGESFNALKAGRRRP